MKDETFLKLGVEVYTNEYINKLREENLQLESSAKMYNIIPQEGFQEDVLSCEADVLVIGGKRGGGKTHVMLMSPLYNIDNPSFSCHGFRKEEDDIKRGLWKASKELYGGEAISKESMFTWVFPSGASVVFEHMQNEAEIDRRYRGVEIPHVIIDELPQITAKTFFTLLASNRNSLGIRNKFIASCNPVGKRNWVYQLLSWYLDEASHEVIHERSGKIRYFYKYGSTVRDMVWGDSREEVYEKAKQYIDAIYDPELDKVGGSRLNMIVSFCFIEGEYSQNKIFIQKDPFYLARLAGQGDAQSFKDIKGVWNDEDNTEGLLSAEEMDRALYNTEQVNGTITAVADVALSRDSFVIGAFNGNHLFDVEAFTGVGSGTAAMLARKFLEKNHVREENFLFDADGIGQYLKEGFPRAVAFNNNSASTDNQIWFNRKSECAEKWTQAVKENKYSVDAKLLKRKFGNKTLEEHLQEERVVLLRKLTTNGKFQLISKAEMKPLLAGKSPDYIDMFFMHENFNIVKPKKREGLWMLM